MHNFSYIYKHSGTKVKDTKEPASTYRQIDIKTYRFLFLTSSKQNDCYKQIVDDKNRVVSHKRR